MRYLCLITLLALPLAVQAQVMQCPDGSYSDICPGGQGQDVETGGLSSYTAPQAHKGPLKPLKREQRQQQSSSRQAPRSGPKPPPDRLMSTVQRARDMGISRNDLVGARSQGNILMGMHREDVEHIMGRPDRVNQATIGGQLCHHLHWRDSSGWTDYIRLCNGRVDHIRQNDID